MGNCIKRETGYEIEESDQDKMKKILANIVRTKQRWRNNLMKVQLEEFNERRQKHREELCLSMNKSQHIELENSTESNIPLQDEESFHSSEFNMTSCKNESEKISLVERKGWDKRKFKTSESSPKRTSYITKSNDSIVMEDDNNESSRRQSIETKGIIENKMFKDSSNYLKHISSTNMLKIIKESSFVYNNFEEECEKTLTKINRIVKPFNLPEENE